MFGGLWAFSNTPKQFRKRDPECPRNLLDVYEREVSLASFDAANVGPVQSAEIGELLLGHSELLPSLAHGSAKPDSNI